MKKKSLIVLSMICLTTLAADAAFAAPTAISIATGGTSGTYYPIGCAIAAAVNKNPELNGTAETGNAAVANTNLVAGGEIEIAFSQADVNTPSVMALLITSDNISEDVVYNFTKTLFKNISDVQGSHAMARNIRLETATVGLTAPLHRGAAKYYREVGINID
ncbi:MAG: hypothetical protein LBK91_01880 [Synergistaceae bacterium]|nr:hypothetical protein [Synergistaceae bacterium]